MGDRAVERDEIARAELDRVLLGAGAQPARVDQQLLDDAGGVRVCPAGAAGDDLQLVDLV